MSITSSSLTSTRRDDPGPIGCFTVVTRAVAAFFTEHDVLLTLHDGRIEGHIEGHGRLADSGSQAPES
jgi:hypothetical protein